jgi:hypothetical protein
MSKMAAADTAVRLQMASDGKTTVYGDKLETVYPTEEAAVRFLLGVSNRLKLDAPALYFDWSSVDATKLLPQTLLMVISLIEQKTIPAGAV